MSDQDLFKRPSKKETDTVFKRPQKTGDRHSPSYASHSSNKAEKTDSRANDRKQGLSEFEQEQTNENLSKDEQATLIDKKKEEQASQPPRQGTGSYVVTMLVFSVLLIILSYFVSPLSVISAIHIKGNTATPDQQLLETSTLHLKEPVWHVLHNKKKISERLVTENEQIKSADVQLNNWNQVQIKVDEFRTVAYLAEEDYYLRVLENGVVLSDEYIHSIGNQPLLHHFKEGAALDRLIDELEQIDDGVLHLISEIEFLPDHPNPMFIQVFMNNGNQVFASIPDFSKKITYYPQLTKAVGDQKGIFDMEVGVYFTPFKKDGDSDEVDEAGEVDLNDVVESEEAE